MPSSFLKRLEKLEEHFERTSCECPPLLVIVEPADRPMSEEQKDAEVAARHSCPIHPTYTGLRVFVKQYSVTVRPEGSPVPTQHA